MRQTLASISSSSQSNREDIEYRSIGFGVEHFGVETDLVTAEEPLLASSRQSVKTDSVQSSSNYLQKVFTKNLLTAR